MVLTFLGADMSWCWQTSCEIPMLLTDFISSLMISGVFLLMSTLLESRDCTRISAFKRKKSKFLVSWLQRKILKMWPQCTPKTWKPEGKQKCPNILLKKKKKNLVIFKPNSWFLGSLALNFWTLADGNITFWPKMVEVSHGHLTLLNSTANQLLWKSIHVLFNPRHHN